MVTQLEAGDEGSIRGWADTLKARHGIAHVDVSTPPAAPQRCLRGAARATAAALREGVA